jgi:hypothetical protein
VEEGKFEDIGEKKPDEPQLPEVDLKPLPKGLKYKFLGPDNTYPVIVSDELSPEENEIGYSINIERLLDIRLMISKVLA